MMIGRRNRDRLARSRKRMRMISTIDTSRSDRIHLKLVHYYSLKIAINMRHLSDCTRANCNTTPNRSIDCIRIVYTRSYPCKKGCVGHCIASISRSRFPPLHHITRVFLPCTVLSIINHLFASQAMAW